MLNLGYKYHFMDTSICNCFARIVDVYFLASDVINQYGLGEKIGV